MKNISDTKRESAQLYPTKLRVLTFNLWSFTKPYETRQRIIKNELADINPDLMVFTEAGMDKNRHQVQSLLADLDYQIIHQFDRHTDLPFDMGLCLASRWKMNIVGETDLNNHNFKRNYPAGAIAVHVDCPQPIGKILLIGAKPIWQPNKEIEREHSSLELARLAQKHKTAFPTIIAGDFDALPDHASIRFLTGKQSLKGESAYFQDAWEEAGDENMGYTWPSDSNTARSDTVRLIPDRSYDRRIDYIFLGSKYDHPDRYAFVRSCQRVFNAPTGGVWPSDHFGVLAEIQTDP